MTQTVLASGSREQTGHQVDGKAEMSNPREQRMRATSFADPNAATARASADGGGLRVYREFKWSSVVKNTHKVVNKGLINLYNGIKFVIKEVKVIIVSPSTKNLRVEVS